MEAHIFVAFLVYCLHVTLRARLKPLAPGCDSRDPRIEGGLALAATKLSDEILERSRLVLRLRHTYANSVLRPPIVNV
jgi:hypothetical protein